MNIAFLCLLLAALMPFALTIAAKAGGHRRQAPFSNRDPRAYLSKLTGWPGRANAAQQNSWEALMLFAPAVLMAKIAQVDGSTLDFWALWFIGWRVAYAICYIADWPAFRSVVWFLATCASLRLMVAAI